jgi:hypothetical protein
MSTPTAALRWKSALPDLIGFVLGLGVAWVSGWTTTDLVWSLWLSSLVVGYAMIVWSIIQPVLELGMLARNDRGAVRQGLANTDPAALVAMVGIAVAFGLFVLGFFTIHFGGFHFIHSQFLFMLFPLGGESLTPNLATYLEVVNRYWLALPSAFLAERSAFLQRTFVTHSAASDISVTPEAIARRKSANARRAPPRIMAPYRKIMRMHAMIIVFGAAHAVRLDGFAVYACVYALYFFPWRLLRRSTTASAATAMAA